MIWSHLQFRKTECTALGSRALTLAMLMGAQILSSLGGSGLHHNLMAARQLVQNGADGLDSRAEEVAMHAMLSASGAWDLCAEMRMTVLST